MSHAEFLRLSRSLSSEDAARPKAFQARLWRWLVGTNLALGFLALLPVLAIAVVIWSAQAQGVGIVGMGVVAIFVSVVMGLAVWGLFFSMVTAQNAIPPGLDLWRKEAPGLFAELDALCRQMRVARFDGVLLSADCNAQVVEGPRAGEKGRRRYLVLGVPLVMGLSPEEMRAVLAHELAHRGDRRPLVRALERVQRWLMSLRRTLTAPNASRPGGILDAPLTWFEPRFNALALVFRRRLELEADAAAARVAGQDAMAGALARLVVLHGRFSAWLDAIGREASQMQHPPADLPGRWTQAITATVAADAKEWLDRARVQTPRPAATHPSLSERWSALKVPPIESPRPAPETSAWVAWLGEARAGVEKKFATWWAAFTENFWQQQRQRAQHSESVRREPEPAADAPPEERERWAWDQACATLALEGKEAARPLFEAVLALNPRHENAGQWLVRERLQADDVTAIDLLRALPTGAANEELWLEAAALYGRLGRADDEARACAEADTAARRFESLQKQCGPLQAGDVIAPHTLAPEYVALLAERAAVLPHIARIAAVRKELKARPGEIFHLIAVQTAGAKVHEQHACAQQLAQAMQVARLPGMWRIVPLGGPFAGLTRLIFNVPGARIYHRLHAPR